MTEVGSHLLGRIVSPPDARDYPLSAFLESAADPLDKALADLLKSTSVAKATKNWAVIATARIKAATPTPTPPPAPSLPVSWDNSENILDQEQTPHCVGFSGAQWGNTLPINDKFDNADGHDFYYKCKVFDGQPNEENGSSIRSLAKTLKTAGRLNTYAFAATVDEAIEWVLTKGPVVFGTDWYTGMFTPNTQGLVLPTGVVEGGHAYLATGYDPTTGLIEYLNSWSDDWGLKGYFYMHRNHAIQVSENQGEILAAVELPL